jgi:hypothetical protein
MACLIVGPPFGTPIPLSDDDTVFIPFTDGFTFTFYGVLYTGVFVNSNGNLTFGVGNTDFTPTEAEFINGPPRIAPMWADFNPGAGGTVYVLQEPDRFVVTWENVPLFAQSDSNTFQVVLYQNGDIAFSYDQLDDAVLPSYNPLVGVAEGAGSPNYFIFHYNAADNPPVDPTPFSPQGSLQCRQLLFVFNGTNFELELCSTCELFCTDRDIDFTATFTVGVPFTLAEAGTPVFNGNFNFNGDCFTGTCLQTVMFTLCDTTLECCITLGTVSFSGTADLLISVPALLDTDCGSEVVSVIGAVTVPISQTCFSCDVPLVCPDICDLLDVSGLSAVIVPGSQIEVTGTVTFNCPTV